MKKFTKIIMIFVIIFMLGIANMVYVHANAGDALFHFSFDDSGNIGKDSKGKGTPEIIGEDLVQVDGKVGKGAQFNGDDTAIHVTSSLNDVKDFTVTFWVRPTTLMSEYSTIIAGDDWSGNGVVHINITSEGSLELGVGNTNYTDGRIAEEVIEEEKWYFVAISQSITDGKTLFYINGEEVFKTDIEAEGNADFSSFTIGAWKNGEEYARHFNGIIDELIIYEGAVDANKIKELTNAVPAEPSATASNTTPPAQSTATATESAVPTTAANTAANTAAQTANNSTNDNAIIFIVIGIIAGVVVCGVIVFVFLKKRKSA